MEEEEKEELAEEMAGAGIDRIGKQPIYFGKCAKTPWTELQLYYCFYSVHPHQLSSLNTSIESNTANIGRSHVFPRLSWPSWLFSHPQMDTTFFVHRTASMKVQMAGLCGLRSTVWLSSISTTWLIAKGLGYNISKHMWREQQYARKVAWLPSTPLLPSQIFTKTSYHL